MLIAHVIRDKGDTVYSLQADATLEQAAKELNLRKVGALVVMDGDVTVEYVKLDTPIAAASSEGTVAVPGEPKGKRMGTIRLKRGHQALLPKGSAYRFVANTLSVMMQQTIAGPLTIEKWGEICYQ